MAATDQKYRSQRTLDVIFAVSCVGMLLTLFWMFYDDYARAWKPVQRRFRDVETALNERQMLEQLPEQDEVKSRQAAVVAARQALAKAKEDVAPEARRLQAARDKNNAAYQTIKADLDSRASYYNIAVDELSYAYMPSQSAWLTREVEYYNKELASLTEKLAQAQAKTDHTEKEYRDNVRSIVKGREDALATAEDELKKVTSAFDRYAKTTAQKRWKWGDSFRNLPILDGFQPPEKIKQIVLNDLTIDYGGFKDVPRNDRCATCHLGIDRASFDKSLLTALTKVPENLKGKLAVARELLEERRKSGESLGFSISDLPTDVTTVKMNPDQVKVYAAHPRLDLFVDSNSPHPMEKVGCTICHGGQGSATEFMLASHTPADARQEEHWVKTHDWHSNHFWDFPMYSSRFVEASCLKCHHQVTDLVRYGSKEEAPKLLRGYNLVRENGCFGCHEIAGLKSGRPVGPDLRLEPWPALDWLSPGDQEKAKSDPANPPGIYRKVGPSLRRLAEKTNQEWTRKWIQDPRSFRPDTKMPHFYNMVSHKEFQDTLRQQDQSTFPATEMHSIAYYLLTESKAHLQGKDTYRVALEEALDWQLLLLDVDIRPLLSSQDKQEWDRLIKVFFPEGNEGGALKDQDRQELDRLVQIAVTGAKQRSELTNENHRDLGLLLLKVQVEVDKQAKKVEVKDLNTLKKFLGDLLRFLEDHGKLTEKNKKELDTVSRQLADLALLSAPARSDEINRTAARQKQFQDRLVELLQKEKRAKLRKEKLEKKETRSDQEDSELDTVNSELKNLPEQINALRTDLAEAVKELKKAGKPVPISAGLVSWDGKKVTPKDMPAADDKSVAAGKKLFTEHGCLACHSHDGTTKGGVEVLGEANFGPNLSRIAAKLTPEVGDPKDPRRWLVQWLLNPNIHHPRTRMPITQLQIHEAVEIADWLLSQKVTDWQEQDPPAPTQKDLVKMARLYLAKAPGMTAKDLQDYLPEDGKSLPGIPYDRLAPMPRDAEEHRLAAGQVTENSLKWYIAKKSITRMGCYGCHDMPGFEQSKPVGAAMNDWGKKDPERLAFEDGAAYVKDHFKIVEGRDAVDDKTKAHPEWKADNDKQPYEKLFYEALTHHTREGFLHLKLAEPRSYDYHRLRAWDDRLRMPQFKFARSRPKKEESEEDFAIRQEREEAEAREAVMTFVLGLVADPIPARHLATPKPDRLAEIKGRQLLDKYNCIGCHQARPGLYEFKPTSDALARLDERYLAKVGEISKTHAFVDHNAWVGVPSPYPDRLMAFGTQPKPSEDEDRPAALELRLTDALRFTNRDRIQRDIPAGVQVPVQVADIISRSDTYGGAFGSLLIPYLRGTYSASVKGDDDARNLLPPPLIREGERVQPNWLYQFLLKPHLIRPQVVLRMPQFNMSPEEAMALVNYFTAVEKLTNPSVGTAGSFLTLDQQDEAYWQRKNDSYVKALSPEQVKKRLNDLKPIWKLVAEDQVVALQPELSMAKEALKTAEEALKKTPNDNAAKEAQKKAADDVKGIEDKIKSLQEQAKKDDFKGFEEEWRDKEAYPADAYRLLLTHSTKICLSCHSAGNIGVRNAPALDRLSERLRPDWTVRWLSSPVRMYPYNPAMPVNFPLEKDPTNKEDLFHGESQEQIRAVRDVLLNYPKISNMPINRYYRPGSAGGK